MSMLLLLFAIPLWLDPQTLNSLLGRATVTVPPATGLNFLTPRPDGVTPGPSPVASAVAADEFQRNLSGTWGTADLGGAYTLAGTGVLSVGDSAGFVQLAPGDVGTAVLGSLEVRDGALDFTVSFDRLPLDGELVANGLLRLTDSGAAYRMAVHVTSAGDVYVVIERVVGGEVARLGGRVLISQVAGAGPGSLRVHAEALGGDPTTLSMRAWMDGAAEPTGWQRSTIDWTSTLQQAGAIGLGWRLDGAPAQQLVLGFGALTAWTLGVDE